MVNFGFTINKSTRIDYDQASKDVSRYVIAHEPSALLCIGCGCCTATCSAGQFTPFNLRRIQLQVHRGELARLEQETEKCMLCGKCQMVCPRGVNTRHLVMTIHKAMTLYDRGELKDL
ncbi:MAG: 4Fe-4S dicluster domain-containing protein [Bacteroidales bacterium]|nr:4Fe-4S dicluster domain-containing protein [Bacteroidales bacterium]